MTKLVIPLSVLLLLTTTILHSEELPLRPGLVLNLESLDPTTPKKDVRISRMAALYVPEGKSPSVFMPKGKFKATYEGILEVDLFDDFTFSLEGRGKISLALDGKWLFEKVSGDFSKVEAKTVELEGRHQLKIVYESLAEGPSHFQLYWASFDFTREPVPPEILKHSPKNDFLIERLKIRKGRELFAEKQCSSCHIPPGKETIKNGMPELERSLPLFTQLGQRFNRDWLIEWIENPRSKKIHGHMPQVFPTKLEPQHQKEISDIVAHLKATPAQKKPQLPGDPTDGEELFNQLGCLGCHQALDQAQTQKTDLISLHEVAHKWKPQSLIQFLLDPKKYAPSIRMPDFRMKPTEARNLASYLIQNTLSSIKTTSNAQGDAENGKKLLHSKGCFSCHQNSMMKEDSSELLLLPRYKTLDQLIQKNAIDKGCLSARPLNKGIPNFQLSASERQALTAFLTNELSSIYNYHEEEYAQRSFKNFRCQGCHTRDGQQDQLSALSSADEESETPVIPTGGSPSDSEAHKLLQTRPLLTWAGEKLQPAWLQEFLTRKETKPVRPWIRVRMPTFNMNSSLFSRGLARQHGVTPTPPKAEKVDSKLAETGKKLLLLGDGFSCFTCHDYGDKKATGAFDAKGPDLEGFPVRLRKDFYHLWMLNPLRFDPRTKMPQFAEEGKTPFAQFFDGDAKTQFEAIWEALRKE